MGALPNPGARPSERERLATASLVYGPLFSLQTMHRRIAHTLPWRPGRLRRTKVTPIAQSEVAIPDDVLMKYDDARQLGVLSQFLIVRPAYFWAPDGLCWLVAGVAETARWAIIASWPPDEEGDRAAA